MRIIAIDPGYERLGIAVLEKLPKQKESLLFSSCVRTSKTLPHAERLFEIATGVRNIIEKWEPQALAVETLFLANNQKTAMPVAEARGVCLYEAAAAGLKVFEYTPLQIKMAVTGYGKSDKRQVTEMVRRLIKLPEGYHPSSILPSTEGRKKTRLDDEYDAIAVGLTCLASHKY